MKVLKNFNEIVTQGYSDSHKALDLVGNNNGAHVLDEIIAIEKGTVIENVTNITGFIETPSYGNYVLIDHGNGFKSRYAHLAYNTTKVKLGDTVSRGTQLGYMGATGTAYGGHLHFELIQNGERINPGDYIFGSAEIIPTPKPDPKPESKPEEPKLIFTCPKKDKYYIELNENDKLYYEKG